MGSPTVYHPEGEGLTGLLSVRGIFMPVSKPSGRPLDGRPQPGGPSLSGEVS